MLDQLSERGVKKQEIVATIVGGANVMKTIAPNWSVAGENLRVALTLLEREGIRVAYSDIGGNKGRTIEHDSRTNITKVHFHSSR
jgi:chemotaxis receptor (MCP) glutamine deamidase CheD